MSQNDLLVLDWPDTGRLDICFPSSYSATLRYTPSVEALDKIAQEANKSSGQGFNQGNTLTFHGQNLSSGSAPEAQNWSKSPSMIRICAHRYTEEASMQKEVADLFAVVSKRYHEHLKDGDYVSARMDLLPMSDIMLGEERYTDSLKTIMVAFHMDVCGLLGIMVVDDAIIKRGRLCIKEAGMSTYDVDELFLDVIRDDTVPCHAITVNDSLYLFQLCMAGKEVEARNIVQTIYGTDRYEGFL